MATQRRPSASAGPEDAATPPPAPDAAGGSEAPQAPRVPAEGEQVHEDDAGGTLTVEAPQGGQPPTAWYVARRPLPVGDELGGEAGRVAAFAEGDLVPADHVERFGWHDHVTRPDSASAEPAGQETPAGQPAPADAGEPAPLPPAQTGQPQLAGPVPQVAAPDQAPATAATGGEES